ncbi:DNA cross-link repair protein pso2/snm1 [Grifola frondosa]|uniref:DNA cross-link repair protein pso2/snm1 n=1 Tax=Grifola frondosa TaxID=5627 RepID=A0A1C7MA98_GRIFR|nr:DNA cross-link repair protein pso2/snm1 [Grifola frondosa]
MGTSSRLAKDATQALITKSCTSADSKLMVRPRSNEEQTHVHGKHHTDSQVDCSGSGSAKGLEEEEITEESGVFAFWTAIPFAPPSPANSTAVPYIPPVTSDPFEGSSQAISSKKAPASGSSHSIDVDATEVEDALLDDIEWGMGDDELDFANADVKVEPNEEVDIDMTIDEPSLDEERSVVTCPLCGTHLKGLSNIEVHEHVDRCIDTMSDTRSFTSSTPASSNSPCNNANIFSVLMSSHKENEAWKEATVVEDRNFRPTKQNGGRRKAPFYKVMQGMPIAVDAFRYGTIPGITAYFLTHAHSDHYTNLSNNWKSGPIYCSQGTANLIIHMLAVDPKWVHPLPMDITTTIPNTGGVKVTLIEANHCPGSCLFLFEGPQTVNAGDSAFKSSFVGSDRIFRYLHCGDFRASPLHVLHPSVKGKRLDHVYLDTTYLDPKYCFPPQPLVISACVELAKRIVNRGPLCHETQHSAGKLWMDGSPFKGNPKKGSVEAGESARGHWHVLDWKGTHRQSHCPRAANENPELHALLTNDPLEAGVHLVPLAVIASDRLKTYMERWKGQFSKAVGFRPTGWTYTQPAGSETLPSVSSIISRSQNRTFTHAQLKPMKNSTPALQVYGVPYSEHSSFFELTCFALSLDWVKMIATVNVGSETSRGKMAKWVEKWEAERRKKDRVEIVGYRAQDYW